MGLSLMVAMLFTSLAVGYHGWKRGLDLPHRQQTMHLMPIPRLGGVAILSGILAGMLSLSHEAARLVPPAPLWIGLLLIASASLWDDLVGLNVWLRFVAHLTGAALFVWPVPMPACLVITSWLGCWPVWPGVAVLALGVAWMTNLYNFMDGTDGLAGGMGMIGFAALGGLGLAVGHGAFAGAGFVIAAAAAGFLLWNQPPASIFMGDSGATCLGFLAAGLILWGARQGLFPPEAGLLIFAPFVVDATVTLLRRAYRRERLWEPHRTHYYQRLILSGCPLRHVLWAYYGLTLAGGVCAIVMVRLDPQERGWMLVAWAGIYALLLWQAENWLQRQAPAGSSTK